MGRIHVWRAAMGRLFSNLVIVSRAECAGYNSDRADTLKDAKGRQTTRIQEIKCALVTSGFLALDEQAKALGMSRSTTWTILRANHKASGLSAGTINRILSAPQLPPLVRITVLRYVEEKTAGRYGDTKIRIRKFANRVHIEQASVSSHLADDPDNQNTSGYAAGSAGR